MKNGVAYKNQKVYLKINIYLNQGCILPFTPVLSLYGNQFTDLWGKSMGWFLYNATLDSSKSILTTTISIHYFLLS